MPPREHPDPDESLAPSALELNLVTAWVAAWFDGWIIQQDEMVFTLGSRDRQK